MIVVTVQMWPGGSREQAYTMGVLHVANNMTGTRAIGNYDVCLVNKPRARDNSGLIAQVSGFRREQSSVWRLVQKAVDAALCPGAGNVPVEFSDGVLVMPSVRRIPPPRREDVESEQERARRLKRERESKQRKLL